MKIEDVINKDTITSVIAVFGLIAVYYQVQQSNKCSLFEKRLNIYSFYKELYDSWISCEMWNDSLDLFIKNQNMPAQAIFLDLTNTVSLYDLCDYFPLDKIDYSKQKEFRKRVAELRNISNSVKFLFKEKIFGIPFEFLDNYVSLLDILYRYQFGVIRRKEITETYNSMPYSKEVEEMCPVAQGVHHGAAPIPEEAKWVQAKEVKDISGCTHGVGWCAPQQGACKLTLNVKEGIIQEALVETIGCSGMTHSAAMAAEVLPGRTILEALNTDLVCDASITGLLELFLQIEYGRTQSAFSDDGLAIGAGLEDLGKGLRSMVGTSYSTKLKGPRYLELTEGYITRIALDTNDEIIGYEFVNLGRMMEMIKDGKDANEALEAAKGNYGRFNDAAKYIDPRKE